MFKTKVTAAIITASLSMSVFAAPAPTELTVINNLDVGSAVKITNGNLKGTCSGSLGSSTPAHSTKQYSWGVVKNIFCSGSPSTGCSADVYPNTDCSGTPIVSVNMHLDTGEIDQLSPTTGSYNVTLSNAQIQLDNK